jgi:threonine/homoserine/homoserine lactone efflux protein
MAILGLVFAFVFSPLGIVFSALGLKQTRQRNEGGRGLAVAGLIVSIIFTVLGLLWLILAVTVLSSAVRSAGALDSAVSSASRALASEGAGLNASNPRVTAACLAIMPALTAAGSDLGSGQAAKDSQAEIAALTQTLQAAATASGDKTFTAHVQKLVDDLRALSTAVSQGRDPSSLEDALGTDGDALDQDCSAAGAGR